MRIEEVTAGQSVTLMATLNGEQLSFKTTITDVIPRKKLFLAAPVYRDDKVVTFRTKDLVVDLLVTRGNEQPILFKAISVTLMKKSDGSLCYNLSAPTDGKPFNRRQHFRCFIGKTVTMQCGLDHDTYDTILKDLSVNSFAVIVASNVNLGKNQVIHVLLEDFVEKTKENFTFHLYGLVVRKEEISKGRFLYGCRLNNTVPGLENYIMIKQRIQLSNSNGGLR